MAQVQRKLEFAVKKNIVTRRSRKEADLHSEKTNNPSIKLEIPTCDNDGPCTPQRVSSRKKVGVSPISNRVCLSPIKNLPRSQLNSPVKQCYSPEKRSRSQPPPGVTDENQCSPRKRRKDPLSVLGSSSKCLFPRPNSPLTSPQKRRTDLPILGSPSKRCLFPHPNSPLTSPQKRRTDLPVLGSPSKKCLFPVQSSPQKTLKKSSPKPTEEYKCRREILKKNPDANQCYHKTKQVLNTAQPERVVCREKEQAEINTFLNRHVAGRTGGSLYISGAPGTGKTAVLTEMMKNLNANKTECNVIYLNCMGVRDSMDIYGKLYTEITGKTSVKKGATQRELCRKMEKFLSHSKISNVWILDEIDQLDSKQHEVLYTLFEWPTLEDSSLILIGIANALDLTDRVLPRLQAQLQVKPQILNFVPYTKDQIVEIIESRLEQIKESGQCMLEPSAIQFCARKVASVAGDMRRALDVCRRAIETVETSIRVKGVLKPTECNSPSKQTATPLRKIGIAHIARVVSEVYGCRVIASTSDSESIPLQQKIAVCTLLLLLKKGKKPAKEVSLGNLHNVFKKICQRYSVVGVDQSEFTNMCSLLDARGIINTKKGKEPRLMKVSLRLNELDLEDALKDKTFVAGIMAKGLP